MFICDAQIHAPRVDPVGQVNGIDEGPLLKEMEAAGVQRAILVPLATKTDPADNKPALAIAERYPTRFRVMGLLDVQQGDQLVRVLNTWLDTPGMAGLRVSCFRDPARSLFLEGRLGWLWSSAAELGIPVMLNGPEMMPRIAEVASGHPNLRLIVDHLGLLPHHAYQDLLDPVRPLLELAVYPNVAVKATCLPSAVPGPYPFRGAFSAIEAVVEAFSASRVFWGSDLTRLPCTYRESITMFTEAIPSLSSQQLTQIMGQGICQWLAWGT
jgi:L-fuconolactonase